MKKLIKITIINSLIFTTFNLVQAETHQNINWAEKSTEFKKMSKKHKMEWFDFCKEWKIKKIDMKKEHKKEWFDYGIEKMEKWSKADFSKENPEKMFKTNLMKALEIRKNHMNDYDKYYTSFYNAGQEKHKQHQKDIAKFEASIGMKSMDAKDDQDDDNDDDDDNDEDDKD